MRERGKAHQSRTGALFYTSNTPSAPGLHLTIHFLCTLARYHGVHGERGDAHVRCAGVDKPWNGARVWRDAILWW